MSRGLLAALAAIVMVGILGTLIVESRKVDQSHYATHAERMRAIESSHADLTTIVQSSREAFETGRPTPQSTVNAVDRLVERNALLQDIATQLPVDSPIIANIKEYGVALASFFEKRQTFSASQNAYSDSLRTIQEESPLVVKDLRRYKLDLQAQITFTAAIDVIEYATAGGGQDAVQLLQRIENLRNDADVQTSAPGTLDTFADAAKSLIEQRTVAQNALLDLSSSSVLESLWATSSALDIENRRAINRAERAGLLLSICTVLLLGGTGYALYSLQSSYRKLNKSNRDLESMNDSLEERVSARTGELTEAYNVLKESQVQLVQAEKMSSLGELVAGISHEINTPLWYLINNATVLQERMEDVEKLIGITQEMINGLQSRENVKETISTGLVGVRRMLKDGLADDIDEAKDLINDSIEGLEELTELAQSLKDFSRLDRARHDEFNVNDGLDKTLLITKNKLKNKVSVHKHYTDVPAIRCSPSQINQIFLNLLTNAADAIDEQGDIVIRTSAQGNNVKVSISDTGCGIPDELMEKIRDPFFTTKEVGKGTGLGLSIVDQIVTSHGGRLDIESEPGKGTTVSITLPLVAVNPDEAANDDVNVEDLDKAENLDDPKHESLPKAVSV